MKFPQERVAEAAKALDELCLNCDKHIDTCYVAVAQRAIATLRQEKETKKEA